MLKILFPFLLIILIPYAAFSQVDNENLIQFSGLIMTSDSLEAVPNVNIYQKNTGRGTVSNYQGFFSLVAQKGDTIIFSSVGFEQETYIVPRNLEGNKYSVIQLMTRDTINLAETIIYPWPTPEQFKEAFLSLDIPDDDLERARKNLEREKLREIGLAMNKDADETVDYYQREEASKYYYYGQVPPMNIFNPFAWGKFIEAWKRGDFKNQ